MLFYTLPYFPEPITIMVTKAELMKTVVGVVWVVLLDLEAEEGEVEKIYTSDEQIANSKPVKCLLYCCGEERRRFAEPPFQLNIIYFWAISLNKIPSQLYRIFVYSFIFKRTLSLTRKESCRKFGTFGIHVLSKFICPFILNIVSFFY
jgi:hypothetical protein